MLLYNKAATSQVTDLQAMDAQIAAGTISILLGVISC